PFLFFLRSGICSSPRSRCHKALYVVRFGPPREGSMQSKITTVQHHILDEERLHPGATGDFTGLLTSLTLAAKIISREVNKAGLVRILGETGEMNVHGESVQKLDEFAQQTICRAMGHNGHLCVMASEESADIIPIPG